MATQIFHPSQDGKGKWHRGNLVTGTALCGAPVILDPPAGAIHVTDEQAHPICCRNCQRIA